MLEKILQSILKRPLSFLTTLFVLTRIALYSAFPFRLDFLPMLNQLLDITLLLKDPWTSIWQLHATPPLYNVFIAGIINVFPEQAWAYAFHAIYGALALGIVLLSHFILSKLNAGPITALLGGIAMIANPIMFRFEIIPFYTLPLAFLILLSIFAFIRFMERKTLTSLVFFLCIPLTIVLFRNFFHVLFFYLPILIGVCALVYRVERKIVLRTVFVAVLLFCIGLLPNVKNYLEYGIFSSSTWQGMQLISMTYFVPEEKIDALIDEGVVTGLVKLPRFQDPKIYYDYYQEPIREGNPAINALYKTWQGVPGENFNNWIYAKAADEYGDNAFNILSRYPEYLVPRIANSMYIFFGTANYRYFDTTEDWMIFTGGILNRTYQSVKYFIQPALLAILFFGTILFLIKKVSKLLFHKKQNMRDAVYLYGLFILLYVFSVSVVVELAENYTARVPIDPLIVILILIASKEIFFKKEPSHQSDTYIPSV
jgi:hypothetical protein